MYVRRLCCLHNHQHLPAANVRNGQAMIVAVTSVLVLYQMCIPDVFQTLYTLPCPAGPSAEASAKKSKPGLAPGPDSAYNPADSSDLPSWITERVRICQRLAPQAPPSPHPAPPPHPPAPALQHQPQSSSAAPNDSNSSKPEFVLYWMRTALRGHENPALVCFLLTSQRAFCLLNLSAANSVLGISRCRHTYLANKGVSPNGVSPVCG